MQNQPFKLTLAIVLAFSLVGCLGNQGKGKTRKRQARATDISLEEQLVRQGFVKGPLPNSVRVGDMVIDIGQIESSDFTSKEGVTTQAAASGFGIVLSGSEWRGGIVPIRFKDAVSPAQKALFFEACREWEKVARVRCIPRTNQEDRIDVSTKADDGCYSQIGRGPGAFESATNMNLAPACWNKGTILHELGHALGLLHEHQRSDRDQYVTMLKQNISKKGRGDILKTKNGRNLGPYDFRSIMHYEHFYYAKSPGLDTILPRPETGIAKEELGSAHRTGIPTELDGAGMAAIYGAPLPIPTYTVTVRAQGAGCVSFAINAAGNTQAYSCTSEASHAVEEQTQIELSANPTGGSDFIRWEGDCAGAPAGPNKLEVTRNLNCTAVFIPTVVAPPGMPAPAPPLPVPPAPLPIPGPQSANLSFIVKNSTNNQPISGAQVTVDGSNCQSATDSNGFVNCFARDLGLRSVSISRTGFVSSNAQVSHQSADSLILTLQPDGLRHTNNITATPSSSTLDPGQRLLPNGSITSSNREYRLIYQQDGNLVVYRTSGGAIWASNTAGSSPGRTEMQGDGNLVIYNRDGNAVWASRTHIPGARLNLSDDGIIVLISTSGSSTQVSTH